MLKVLVATGGTGGHLFPAQQLKELLQDCDLLFAGHKLANSPFFDRGFVYQEICSSGKKSGCFSILKGVFQSLRMIVRFKPHVVIGFGSFHSFPVLLAAVLLRKKIILFEPNCSFGKVNRFFIPFAKKVALQFPIYTKKAVHVPLLPWVCKRSEKWSAEEARRAYGLAPDVFTILVFGGSQGAQFINQTFCAAASLFTFAFQVIHLTGKEAPEIKYQAASVVKTFETDMLMAYAAADLVVCRCGAGTVAELIRFQKPALLIPYPFAYDHQRKNGEFLKEGARVLLQKETNPQRLAAEVVKLKEELQMRKAALQQIALPKTVDFGSLVRAVGERR